MRRHRWAYEHHEAHDDGEEEQWRCRDCGVRAVVDVTFDEFHGDPGKLDDVVASSNGVGEGLRSRHGPRGPGVMSGFRVVGRPDTEASAELADAAQEAEHLHAETGRRHSVASGSGDVVYVSKGPPP